MKKDTRIIKAGRNPFANHGVVNPPVYHASTILYPDMATMAARAADRLNGVYYGHFGTPTTFAFEEAVAELEGGERCVAVPTGLAAITVSMLAFLKTGDEVLVTDNAYGPIRRFCDNHLKRFGITPVYYDPMIGADIAALITPKTGMVVVEAPGSLTFEVQDIPAIARVAHDRGVLVLMDNTWSAGYYYKAFDHGVDISIQAATKYISGHSDVMAGTIVTRQDLHAPIKWTQIDFGYSVGPDVCYQAARGLRTLATRLGRHQESSLKVAAWLAERADVKRLLHPAFPDCPGHEIWQRDFTGSSGLFAFVTAPAPAARVAAMIDGMDLFGLGESWGGFESLITAPNPKVTRTATSWDPAAGQLFRLHIGLEDPDDMIADLDAGLARLAGA